MKQPHSTNRRASKTEATKGGVPKHLRDKMPKTINETVRRKHPALAGRSNNPTAPRKVRSS